MIKTHLAIFQNGTKRIVMDSEMATFQAEEPDSFSLTIARVVEVDNRFYVLDQICPDNGLELWTNIQSSEEVEKETKILALKTEDRNILFPNFKTRSEKVSEKIQNDFFADQRTAEGKL